MVDLLEKAKLAIPDICLKLKVSYDEHGDGLKKIVDTAQREKKNASKIPDIQFEEIEGTGDDGSKVVEQRYGNYFINFLFKMHI